MIMKTITVKIQDNDYLKYGFKKDIVDFTLIRDKILCEIGQQTLLKSVKLAEKYGLSKMTLEEIDKEIDEVRKKRKS